MRSYFQPAYRKIFIFINICVIISYLFVCLVPFVNTGENWFIAVPGIVFPLLLLALLLMIPFWIVKRSRFVWVSVVTVILGFQQIAAVFSFHLPHDFSSDKLPHTLRVLQWNVMGWDEADEKVNIENGAHSLRPVMMDEVQVQNADILCFEEFFESADTGYFKSNISAITKMGFPNHFFVPLKNDSLADQSGIIIFSKYPIIDSAAFDFSRDKKGEHLVYADIRVNRQIFRVFATHLIPINFAQWDNDRSSGSGSGDYHRIFSKLLKGYSFRYHQALFVGQKIAESPYPVIICGDFNDIPNSSTYFNIRGDLQDPFLKQGYWTGRTTRRSFGIFSPTLRIDYILASKSFKVNQFQILHVNYSDHYPVETDLRYLP